MPRRHELWEFCWCDLCKEARRNAEEAAKQAKETASVMENLIDSEVMKSVKRATCAISHQYCQKCGYCMDCGDCSLLGCGEGIAFSMTYVTTEAFRALKQDYEDAEKTISNLRRQVEQQGFTIAALHNDYAACIGQRDRAMSRANFLSMRVKILEGDLLEYLGG